MAESYFKNFNLIQYANSSVVDITERVVIQDNTLTNPYYYYPVDITNDIRADVVAYNVFQDPYLSWLIYLTNGIHDPYYDWYLVDYEFNLFIKEKYGSIENAMQKVKYYRNQWYESSNLTIGGYDALTPRQQQYWEPNYDILTTGRLLDYSRKRNDFIVSTNFVINFQISGNSYFIEDEVVQISYSGYSDGKGQVLGSNATNIFVQHISEVPVFTLPDTPPIGPNYCYGKESGSNCVIVSAIFVSNNIHAEELDYWAPVYYYDYEVERNEGNKTIRIVKADLAQPFITEFKRLFKGQ